MVGEPLCLLDLVVWTGPRAKWRSDAEPYDIKHKIQVNKHYSMHMLLLLFAFQSMFMSIWVSRLEIAEFPDCVCWSTP